MIFNESKASELVRFSLIRVFLIVGGTIYKFVEQFDLKIKENREEKEANSNDVEPMSKSHPWVCSHSGDERET